jgi:hypothetical protein
MALVLLQAADADDVEDVGRGRVPVVRLEVVSGQVDTAVDDVRAPTQLLADVAGQELAVEAEIAATKETSASLRASIGLRHEDVVGVHRDAVADARQLVRRPRREQRVGGVVRVHMLDAVAADQSGEHHARREEGEGTQHHSRLAVAVAHDRRPQAQVRPWRAHELRDIGGQQRRRARREVLRRPGPRHGICVHQVGRLTDQRVQPDVPAACGHPGHLAQDERLRQVRESATSHSRPDARRCSSGWREDLVLVHRHD